MGFRLVRSHDAKPCPVRLCKAKVFVVGAGVQGGLPHILPLHVRMYCIHTPNLCTYVHTYVHLQRFQGATYVRENVLAVDEGLHG